MNDTILKNPTVEERLTKIEKLLEEIKVGNEAWQKLRDAEIQKAIDEADRSKNK